MANYLNDVLTKPTTQGEKIASDQVQNYSGAYVWEVDDFKRLQRFLILGSEGGTYYATEKSLTKENATAVARAIKQDGLRVVREIVDISDSGRAPKNDPALFALAMAMTLGDDATRKAAFDALPKVARIGTHLFHWAAFFDAQRGWGKGARKAVSNWYLSKSERELAMQVIKYPQRDGWSHRDLLRLGHVQSANQHLGQASETRNAIFKFIVDGWEGVGNDPHPVNELALIWAAERAKGDISEKELLGLIADYRLPMEAIPSEKQTKAVYEALIPHAGITWLIRNLGNLSKRGVIATGQYSNLSMVIDRLTNIDVLKKGRVHPLSVLSALATYKSGKGVRGNSTWPVISDVVDALDSAFYMAFDAVEPTNKRYVLGIDVSGSMTYSDVAGMPGITPNIAASAMAMVTKRVEPYCAVMGFAHDFRDLKISKTDRLDVVSKKTQISSFGSTDCSLPITWAMSNRVEADTFVIYTDSDTNQKMSIQPVIALNKYRQKMGIPARLVVVAMTSGEFTIADPSDAGMLDIVGMDSSAPAVIAEFSKGNL